MGLPIKETIYTWRHSKHKLPLSSETESHLIFQECRLKGKLLFQYRHQRLALFFPLAFFLCKNARTHTMVQTPCIVNPVPMYLRKKKEKEKETNKTSEPRLPLGNGLSQMSLSPPKKMTSGVLPPPTVR